MIIDRADIPAEAAEGLAEIEPPICWALITGGRILLCFLPAERVGAAQFGDLLRLQDRFARGRQAARHPLPRSAEMLTSRGIEHWHPASVIEQAGWSATPMLSGDVSTIRIEHMPPGTGRKLS